MPKKDLTAIKCDQRIQKIFNAIFNATEKKVSAAIEQLYKVNMEI